MRKALPICLLVAAGCASAGAPEPQGFSIRRLSSSTPVITADRVKHRLVQVSTACETNDRMAVGAPVARASGTPPTTQAPRRPGVMPNAGTSGSLSYIPNACPVTAGPLANRSTPAVLAGPGNIVPVPPRP
ncbi:hypothetical protein [Longimicrobium sp.]|uniref:hypothetical protein n=1 Tax=Longimicrobium sp. TaxID=2029185 RepID=UPI002E367350|nr:hypothetical protein [Longimicrobium sp.]HEX6036511.1 hypothetical protein [Longimicrobium sp.]